MEDPWYLITDDTNDERTIKCGKENFSYQYECPGKHGCSCCSVIKPSEIDDVGFDILKSDVHWHNSEPVSSDIVEYLLTDKPSDHENDTVPAPVGYCWHIDSPAGVGSNDKTDNNEYIDNKSDTSSNSSSDGCSPVKDVVDFSVPFRIDIPTEAACGVLKDVNYEFSEIELRKDKKKEKTIKISPIFQGDPYFAHHRMLINKRQNDRLSLLNNTFKYLNNSLPPYIKCNEVRDNTKLGILRRAIKYIDILKTLLDDDDKNKNDNGACAVASEVDDNGGNNCVELLETDNNIMNARTEFVVNDRGVDFVESLEKNRKNNVRDDTSVGQSDEMEDNSSIPCVDTMALDKTNTYLVGLHTHCGGLELVEEYGNSNVSNSGVKLWKEDNDIRKNIYAVGLLNSNNNKVT